jgi:hypothetical protein
MNQETKLLLLMKKNRSKKSRASVPLMGGKYGGKSTICQHAAIFPQGKLRRALVRRLAEQPNFNQDVEQRSRATYADEAASGWSRRW